ncbi:hypothetical protein L1D52_24005 [Vibrio brasiliensis]|uniref:hypothetical protein n=1 Tax=Vibrio brasiliensis TaxID=170652 RepID=UPI001EFD5579|nr:hypothetical protein [Vibrio brasiliensis]MCG9785376.1 hypothetical protein [Vibrio brasiliensis]
MKQETIDMIEKSGIKFSELRHVLLAVGLDAKQQIIGEVYNELLAAFDVQIGNEQQERSAVLKESNGVKDSAWWAHNGRVDGVDTGRALVERVMAKFEEEQSHPVIEQGYIATAEIDEEEIGFFGEGDTPDEALSYFNLDDYISVSDFENGDELEIGVFKAIRNGSEEWEKGDYREEFVWVLGERVKTKFVTVKLDESESK